MLRTQKDVDKHVQEVLRKITNEKERNLRCYNVAKLYHKVGDFQSAKSYVEVYLKDRPKVAGAHKLLGQCYEGLKDYAKALEEYKCSLSFESRQPDLVLKVCELLVETKSRLNAGEAKYWIERAEEVTDNHQAVFRLKEHLLQMEDGSGDQAQLAQLVEKEIEARPQDHVPRIRLINLYLDSKRILDAYTYSMDLESRGLFRGNLQWYCCIVEVLRVYHQHVKNVDSEFHLNQLSVMERCVALSSCGSQTASFSKALFTLDQAIFEALEYCREGDEKILEECIRHMSGQLSFYLASAVLRIGKQSRTGWKEWTPYAWALMTIAYATRLSLDSTPFSSAPGGKERHKNLQKLWRVDSAFRCSQAGHILLSMSSEKKRFTQLNLDSWRVKTYKLLFVVQMKGTPDAERSSFFLTDSCFASVPESTPVSPDLSLYDSIAQHQQPDSLHSLVWFGLRHVEPGLNQMSPIGTPYVLSHRLSPNFACHTFEELKFSTSNLENAGVETLNRLDVETFLFASVFCSAATQDERHLSSIIGEGRPITLPINLTESLCSEAQIKWWSNAYRLHSNKSRGDIGELRMVVSRGLEVVRLLGNHGMDVKLVVLLAKLFTDKASSMSTPKDNIPDVSKRAQLFWNCAVSLLERIEKNQPLRMSTNSLFLYSGKELSSMEVRVLLEEGRYFLACCLMQEMKYEEAIEAFQVLKTPYASFHEGLLYKKLADVELDYHCGEKTTSGNKSQYVILLQKSRAALHLTLDRLRLPQNAGNHPLNVELAQHLEEVESCLAREESINFVPGVLDETFGTKRIEDAQQNASRFVNTSVQHSQLSNIGPMNGQTYSQGLTSTPLKTQRAFDPNTSIDASSAFKLEARPSPERLDAQLRRMTVTTDAVMQVVVEQNRQMLDSNRTLMDALEKTRSAVEDLQKQMSELKLEVGRLKDDSRSTAGKNVNFMNPVHSEEDYEFNVAPSQLRSYGSNGRVYAPPFSDEERFNYHNQSSGGPVPFQQGLFPSAQVAIPRNVDPNLLLASLYPQAPLRVNFNDRQGAPMLPVPGSVQGTASFVPGPSLNNLRSAVSGDNLSADSYHAAQALMGAPILSHSTVAMNPIDVSASPSGVSMSQSQMLPSLVAGQQSVVTTQPLLHNRFAVSPLDSIPHNFQIAMPPQATIPTTESLEKCLSPLKPVATEAVLQNVPMPTYSAVSVRKPDMKPSRLSSGSGGGNDSYTEDADYNPCADFKPIVPLPAEITVTTGEEDETALFVRRAKLFRFCTKEWKERGTGDIKILKHDITGKVRVLMRREQVHKICANHYILPEMELTAQTGSDRAWSWAANDFSDGEARIEKLCVRFKSVEDALDFKEAFDNARKLAKDATPVKGSAPINVSTKLESTTLTSQASSPVGKVELGGFSFVSVPVLKPVERPVKSTSGKDKENVVTVAKPSPFAGFSFTPSTNAVGSPMQPVLGSASLMSTPAASTSSSSLINSNQPAFTSKLAPDSLTSALSNVPIFSGTSGLPDFASIAAVSKGSELKKDTSFKGFEGAGSKVFGGHASSSNKDGNKSAPDIVSGDTDEFVPTAVFNPVVPLPSLIEVRTGEEGETVLFEERAKLLRFDSKEWKERGVGKMKVMKNPDTLKVRLLMRREQVLKVCCNHFLTPDLQFKPLTTSDKAVTWSAQDFSEGEVRMEVFALKFKTPDLVHSFINLMENLQKEITNASSCNSTPTPKVSSSKSGKPLSELFKPKEGSWECNGCFTRNDAEVLSCPCCSQLKPGYDSKVAATAISVAPQFSFGVPPHPSNPEAISSAAKVTFTSSAQKDKQPSLAELFKPKEGSWECTGCFTRNNAENLSCPCCSQPKPGSEMKPAIAPSSSSQFSFGIPPSQSASNSTINVTFGSTPSTGKQTSLADLFKRKQGSWECQCCYLQCDAEKVSCPSCNTPKPGCEGESGAQKNSFAVSSFSFGSSDTAAGEALESKAFTFGTQATQAEAKSAFVFGAPTTTVQDVNKGFSFGSVSSSTNTTDFVFGASNVTPNQSNQSSFGDPHKFEFHMKASSPSKSPGKASGASGGEESDEEDVVENVDVGDFKPVVPLPDKVPVLTGEEDEFVMYCHRAKLYRFVSDSNPAEWKERGLGDIKVLRHNKTNKPRLLMRREQVLKICLNHYIAPDLDMVPKDEKTWMWGAQDFSDGVLSIERFACRFKSAEIAAEFKQAVDKAKLEIVLPSPPGQEVRESLSTTGTSNDGPARTSEALKTFSFKLPSGDKSGVVRSLFTPKNDFSSVDEVEVVYEAQVTPEEKSAALKLKLPENFYRYKHAPPCSGCRGCEKDSDSDLGDSQSSDPGAEGSAMSSTTTLSAPTTVIGSGSSLFSSPSLHKPSSSIFGGLSSPSQTSSKFSSHGLLTYGAQSTAVNSHSTAFPILGPKLTTPAPGEEESISFLPVNNSLSFASLASVTSSMSVFQPKDPSSPFSFEGAGSKVFGAGSTVSPSSRKTRDNDEDDSGGEHDANETGADAHDPHFEPIIAMPDVVEVRTGEEDEEKFFCQRAKLFRYDAQTKEWKERGVGEMKILKHPVNETFRLLLRRDQVHKVVLNQRIDSEVNLKPLKTSDKAWCWGGINHAEDPAGALEELAVRFKTSEIADEFRSKVEDCQKLLMKGAHSQIVTEADDGKNDEDDDDDDEYEDDEDDVDEGDFEILFEEPVSLVAEVEGSIESTIEGEGCIRVIATPDHSYYVEMEDKTGNILCKTPIIGDSEVQRNGEVCVWKSVDIADDDEGIEKKFISTFQSSTTADSFQDLFSKITLEIVEQTYDYVEAQED